MRIGEVIRFTASSARSHRLRSGLTALGIAIGVTAVVLLTSIGVGLRDYMLNQFTQFGTNILAINPGKAQTFGMPAGVLNSSRPLSLDDAVALKRLPYVESTLPMVQGTASVEGGGANGGPSSAAPGTSCPRHCPSTWRWASSFRRTI